MDLNDKSLPLNGPAMDLNKVTALNHTRSISFLNSFLIKTVHFLNNFSVVSEEHMAKQLLEMQKLEVAINILEAKLNSVPGLNDVAAPSKPAADSAPPGAVDAPPLEAEQKLESQPAEEVSPSISDPKVITAKEDPRYARYFKMIAVGVPKGAIEGKMRLEGLDPTLLDTPDAPVPDSPVIPDNDDDSDESDDESRSLSSDDDWD